MYTQTLQPWIGTEDTIPNGGKVDKSDTERRVLWVELCESVVDGLDPCLTPGILVTTAVNVGDKEVLGICGGFGEEGHLAEEALGCLREIIAVDWSRIKFSSMSQDSRAKQTKRIFPIAEDGCYSVVASRRWCLLDTKEDGIERGLGI